MMVAALEICRAEYNRSQYFIQEGRAKKLSGIEPLGGINKQKCP